MEGGAANEEEREGTNRPKSHRKRAERNDEDWGVEGRGLRRLTASDKALIRSFIHPSFQIIAENIPHPILSFNTIRVKTNVADVVIKGEYAVLQMGIFLGFTLYLYSISSAHSTLPQPWLWPEVETVMRWDARAVISLLIKAGQRWYRPEASCQLSVLQFNSRILGDRMEMPLQ